jgi:hypothetical protein
MFNDLIGLRYRWGSRPSDRSGFTDCWQLACEVRDRLGLVDHRDRFQWVYEEKAEGEVLVGHVLRWLYRDAERVEVPSAGSIACLRGNASRAVLGVCVSAEWIIFIGPGGHSISAPISMLTKARFFNA